MDTSNILLALHVIFTILIMLFIILNFIEKIKEKKAYKYIYLEIPLNRLNESDTYYSYDKILFNEDGVLLKKDRKNLTLQINKKTTE